MSDAPTSDLQPYQFAALSQMLLRASEHTQRIVEQLRFSQVGGQLWSRNIQIRIPDVEALPESNAEHSFVVSLGMFERRRFPDIEVRDANGARVNFATRLQHGMLLSMCALDQYFGSEFLGQLSEAANQDSELLSRYTSLYHHLYTTFTTVVSHTDSQLVNRVADDFDQLLTDLGEHPDTVAKKTKMFVKGFTELAEVTQYLCWVTARCGDVVNLTATYSMEDAVSLSGPATEFNEDENPETESSEDATLTDKAKKLWTELKTGESRGEHFTAAYARSGIGPMSYLLRAPTHDHCGSYYFSVEPPAESRITLLDWGLGNSIEHESGECNCSNRSFHIHNGPALEIVGDEVESDREADRARPRKHIKDSRINLFVRPEPVDHLVVSVGAALNVLFALLVNAGHLTISPDSSPQAFLVLTPAFLIAYVTQQRRHYYAASTTWLRAFIWFYLMLNVGFLVAIGYDVVGDDTVGSYLGFSDKSVSGVFSVVSLGMALIFLPLGNRYDRFVAGWFVEKQKEIEQEQQRKIEQEQQRKIEQEQQRKIEQENDGDEDRPGSAAVYSSVARRYGNRIVGTAALACVVLAVAVATGLTAKLWGDPLLKDEASAERSCLPCAVEDGTTRDSRDFTSRDRD